LDCGEDKPYATLADGLVALKQFCKDVGLPRPTIIQSGRGAHVYWILDNAITRQEWKPYAERLKALCVEHNFHIDAAVPADPARILRIPETMHLKDVTNPLPVQILRAAQPIALSDIETVLTNGRHPQRVFRSLSSSAPWMR